MSDKISKFISDHLPTYKHQLLATAVASGVSVASLILGSQALSKGDAAYKVRSSEGDAGKSGSLSGPLPPLDQEDARNQKLARRAQAGNYDEELILEQLARNHAFLGPDGLAKLREAFVVVVGCGGVGSHCTAALARSGVSKLRLIDFDQVTLSSLNRHAVATLADVGSPKVVCLQRRLVAIAPWTRYELMQEKFEESVAERMLGGWGEEGDGDEDEGEMPDFVVDAIDNIDTKVALLKYCHDNRIPVISAMGAGCKSDPTRIIVGDIGTSTDDGLSRATRRRLKLKGITSGIPVVYSTEKSGEGKAELLPLDEEEFNKGNIGDLGPMAEFRVRILPVLGTMPAIFGMTAANHVILSLTGYPLDYVPAKGRDKMYDGILNYVQGFEERLARSTEPDTVGLKLPLTVGDVAFLTEELFHGRSAITGIPTKLVLMRWRKPEGSSMTTLDTQKCSTVRLSDLVCMTKEEAIRHEKEVFKKGKSPRKIYDRHVVERVEAKLKEAEEYEVFR